MVWMISANAKIYDYTNSFATNGFVDWRQRVKYSIDDIVYIYCIRPFKRVMYKCKVVKHSIPFSECVDDAKFWIDIDEYEKSKSGVYVRLKLLEQVDTKRLSLEALIAHGLKTAPQGPVKVKPQLHSYIDSCFDDFYTDGLFTDVNEQKEFHEGHVRSVKVDIYERSSIARSKCIEHYGLNCMICGLNFGDRYGALGEGFIHIHHLRPLHTIGRDYIVDYKKDLIPVCPNCHAMIHRISNGENMNVDEIKSILAWREKTKGSENSILMSTSAKPKSSIISTSEHIEKKTFSVPILKETFDLSNVKHGTHVTHKMFGEGTVIKIDVLQKHIFVSFSTGEKTFLLPDAFTEGYLRTIE